MGYLDNYKGTKRRKRKRLLVVLLCLALLLALLLGAFLILQDHIVYTDDGGFYFDFQKPAEQPPVTPASPAEPLPDVPLVIEPGGNEPAPPVTPQEPVPPVEEPPLPRSPLSAQWTTAEALLAGWTPADGLSLSVKGTDGVCWVADPRGAENGAAPRSADLLAALEALSCRKVAVVSALRDPLRPRTVDRAAACQVTSGTTWLDWDYCSWYSPYAAGTADYLNGLLQSCADAGFEEVILIDFQFPVRGKTELIDYGDQTLSPTDALTALARSLTPPEGLTVSCLLTDTAARSGADGAAGQDAAALADAFGKVWVRTPSPDNAAPLEEQLGAGRVALWLTAASDAADLPDHIVELP